MIVFHEESKTFHLYNNEISYVFKILENNQLGQLYYGKRIHDRKDFDHLLELFSRPMSPCSYKGDLSFSLEHIKQEYPVLWFRRFTSSCYRYFTRKWESYFKL